MYGGEVRFTGQEKEKSLYISKWRRFTSARVKQEEEVPVEPDGRPYELRGTNLDVPGWTKNAAKQNVRITGRGKNNTSNFQVADRFGEKKSRFRSTWIKDGELWVELEKDVEWRKLKNPRLATGFDKAVCMATVFTGIVPGEQEVIEECLGLPS